MTVKTFIAKRAVAATEHPYASQAALSALQAGGNAFDAAASASFVLSVVQPHLSGLGGDFFGLFYEGATGRIHCLNASGWSPSSMSLDRVSELGYKDIPKFGHASVVVPGCVEGVYQMHRKFGRLPFASALKRAVELAEDGFPVGPGLARSLGRLRDGLSPKALTTFLRSGEVPPVGAILKQKHLANTLRGIAESGARGFYRGDAADAIIEEMSSGGVEYSRADFSTYSAEWCEPIKLSYRGTDVYEVPPNSMGATSLLILKQLEGVDMASLGPDSAERIRVMVEAARVAYAARDREIGDPRFSPFHLDKFLSTRGFGGPQKRIDKADTTYFAVADREGNLLSCIQSVFHNFGSRVFVDGGGFFLNNRGSAFSREGPNKLEPRKRPLHTLSSLLLSRDGRPFAAVGASGGDYRPQQHALFATNVIDYGMGLGDAIDFPRFLWDGSEVDVEKGYKGTSRLRMHIKELAYPGRTGVAQGVQLLSEALVGVCDTRSEGLPAGE